MPRAKDAPKATKWRESSSLMVYERAKHWARRCGMTLEVVLVRGEKAVSDRVDATIERVVQPEGRHEQLARMSWPVVSSDRRVVANAIAVAMAWAEHEADEQAGTAA